MFCVTDFLKVLWAKTARKRENLQKTHHSVQISRCAAYVSNAQNHTHTSTFILSHSIHTQKDIKFARVVKDYNNTLKKKHTNGIALISASHHCFI